jgi:hypothetical protein
MTISGNLNEPIYSDFGISIGGTRARSRAAKTLITLNKRRRTFLLRKNHWLHPGDWHSQRTW